MGICGSKRTIDIEPSVPTPEKTQSSQPTSIPGGTSSTPSPRPGTAGSARACAQSQGAASSQRRHDHDDGRDYPCPSSSGDVSTSQHPDHKEMPSRQYPSGGTGRIQRARSVPMGVAVSPSPSAPSQMSRRTNCSASPVVNGSEHRRIDTQSQHTSVLSPATSQITAGRQGGRSRFPFALQGLLPNDFRYAVQL
jgi:hypothetical protein